MRVFQILSLSFLGLTPLQAYGQIVAATPCFKERTTVCSDVFAIPDACGSKPCSPYQTGWADHPTERNVQRPVFEYRCNTEEDENGGPTVTPTVGAHDIRTQPFSTYDDGDLGDLWGSEQVPGDDIICYVMKTCSLSCTAKSQLLPPSQWLKNRWHPNSNSSGDPGVTETYEAGCNNGIGNGIPQFYLTFAEGPPCEPPPPPPGD